MQVMKYIYPPNSGHPDVNFYDLVNADKIDTLIENFELLHTYSNNPICQEVYLKSVNSANSRLLISSPLLFIPAIIEPTTSQSFSFCNVPHVIYNISTEGFSSRVTAITIDDGPGPLTTILLDLLKKYNIKATFFFLGKHMIEYPDIVRKTLQDGHVIGIHSWQHQDFNQDVKREELEKLIDRSMEQLHAISGYRSCFFRPSYGSSSPVVEEVASSRGLSTVYWTTEADDSLPGITVKSLVGQIINHLEIWPNSKKFYPILNGCQLNCPGPIILFHDAFADGETFAKKEITLKALEQVLVELKAKKYIFVKPDGNLFITDIK